MSKPSRSTTPSSRAGKAIKPAARTGKPGAGPPPAAPNAARPGASAAKATPAAARPIGGTSKTTGADQRSSHSARKRKQAQQEQLRRNLPIFVTLGLVVAAIVVFVSISLSNSGAGTSSLVSASMMRQLSGIPASEFAAVDTGGVTNALKPISNAQVLKDASGKPVVVYVGAEFCPFCAASRWSMVVALSRFGTFSNLRTTTSSSTDAYANTATFTFVGSSYTSQYVSFAPVETEDRAQQPLQTPTALQQQAYSTYDATPYVQNPGIPFLDVGDRYSSVGTLYDPGVLTGLSASQIAGLLSDPTKAATLSIIGAANYLTAGICALTNNQPASVCAAAPIPALQAQLGK